MENSILNHFPVDPGIILITLMVITVISLVIMAGVIFQYRRLYRRYDVFMRGKDAETLEDVILDLVDETEDLRSSANANQEKMDYAMEIVKSSFRKLGMVKYNAFKGMGGNLSFAIALLDENNTGFVLNSVHSRDGCYLYMKDVLEGRTEVLLGNEEREALEQALGYIGKPGRSRRKENPQEEEEAEEEV
ncbi:DUF4446 family protein [[Clostridium] aminophilum]|uniref:DUF4446 family protein n=1 Tax=[Clostridium] aminophilum TaxID=1526 RepID=UPI003F9C4561